LSAILKASDPVELPQITELPQTTLKPLIVELPQTTEFPQITEEPVTRQLPQMTELPQITELLQTEDESATKVATPEEFKTAVGESAVPWTASWLARALGIFRYPEPTVKTSYW